MSNEYDYSGLYNNGQGGNTPDPNQGQNNDQPRNEANQASTTRPDQPSQPEQGGYPKNKNINYEKETYVSRPARCRFDVDACFCHSRCPLEDQSRKLAAQLAGE